MPFDLQQFSAVIGSAISVPMPTVTLNANVVDAQTGALKGNYTLIWPSVWTTFTAAEKLELGDVIINKVLEIKMRALG